MSTVKEVATEASAIINPSLPVAHNMLSKSLLNQSEKLRNLLRRGVDFDQFISCCVQATNVLELEKFTDPRTMKSYAVCVQNCAILGLLPGSALGHAYFVPYTFYRNSPREHDVIQLIPGYRGLLELAWEARFLLNCDPEVVVEGEDVERWHDKDGPQIWHKIPIPRTPVSKENILGAYCTYRVKGGSSVLGEFVEATDLLQIAKKSSGKSPWRTNFEAMAKKTAVRRTSKRWRQTRNLSLAVALDEQAEAGLEQESFVEEVLDTTKEIDLDKLPISEGEKE